VRRGRRVIRAAAAALIGVLASALLLALFTLAGSGISVGFDGNPPRLVYGFYPAERDHGSGLTFAWTGAEAGLRLPGLDRRVAWTLTLRVRGARPDRQSNPVLTFFADGILLKTHQTTTDFEDLSVAVPPRPDRRGVTILIRSSSTFVPSTADRRQLGVLVDSLTLTPDGLVLPQAEALGSAMLSGAALGASVAALGVTAGSAIGAAVVLSAGVAAALAHGFGPYTNYPGIAGRLSLTVSAVLVLIAGYRRWRGLPLRNTARFAVAFAAGACLLRLLVLLHPDMPIGDALFHAHRFQDVLAGHYYFTSVAPGGYAFPYAPGLYVAASPFAGLVRGEMGNAALLRVFTAAAASAVGLLLYLAVARNWNDRLAGAFAVALYHLPPLSFLILTGGALTNAFAESVAALALATIALVAVPGRGGAGAIALTAVLTVAFLSHTSTFAILSACAFISGCLFLWKGGPALRKPAVTILIATVASVVLVVALYYAHFGETYRTEFARLGVETATDAPDAGGRGVLARLAAVPRYFHFYLGVPILLLAAIGAVEQWRRGARDRLTLTVAAWIIACGLFFVIGVVTPLDMRYYLAVIPALALLGAAGASWWWSAGGRLRIGVAVLLVWTLWVGVTIWRGILL
jgi:hypothetical protein